MPRVTIEHPHNLPTTEVRDRLDAMRGRLARYGIEASWKSQTEAVFKRTGASGSISCRPDKVVVDVDLSFVLAPMKGEVETRIKNELAKALG